MNMLNEVISPGVNNLIVWRWPNETLTQLLCLSLRPIAVQNDLAHGCRHHRTRTHRRTVCALRIYSSPGR